MEEQKNIEIKKESNLTLLIVGSIIVGILMVGTFYYLFSPQQTEEDYIPVYKCSFDVVEYCGLELWENKTKMCWTENKTESPNCVIVNNETNGCLQDGFYQCMMIDAMANCIKENSELFFQLGCSACEKQKIEFGYFYETLNVTDCFYDIERCNEKDITATPTWIIGNESYENVYSFDEIVNMTGCFFR